MNDTFNKQPTQDNFITEKVDIYKNNLLGEYDANGNYAIAPQIVQELIDLKKFRKNSYDNSMFCFGNLLGYGEIAFEVCFDKTRDSENRATASLYVLEDVDKVNGYLQNIIKTKLAEFVSNVGDFIEESYARFNVTDSNDDNDEEGKERKTLDDLELDDSYILAKKAYMLLLDKLSDERMLDAYGKYFTARLSALTKIDNEFSNAVLDAFNQRYELIEEIFLKEKNYKALNELLDTCIESVAGTKEIYVSQQNEFNQMMSENLNEFTDNITKLSDKVEQKAINMLDPEDRNKMDQMNASLDNANTSNEVKFESIDDRVRPIENQIDESFQNPVFDAYEEEKELPQQKSEEMTSENDDEITETENKQNNESIMSYIERNNQGSEEPQIAQPEIQEEAIEGQLEETPVDHQEHMSEYEQSKVQDDIINHILSMQEDTQEAEPEAQEESKDAEELDSDISEDYISSNADFQKSRQSDRLFNITDRLSMLSGESGNKEQEIEQTDAHEESEQQFDGAKEEEVASNYASVAEEETTDNQVYDNNDNTASNPLEDFKFSKPEEPRLDKDRLSMVFDMLKKQKSTQEDMSRDDRESDEYTR